MAGWHLTSLISASTGTRRLSVRGSPAASATLGAKGNRGKQISPDRVSLGAAHVAGEISGIAGEVQLSFHSTERVIGVCVIRRGME